MATLTDEQKQELTDKYLAAEPNSENSMEIVKEISEDGGFSPNQVRMMLSKAGVYVTKSPAKKPAASATSGGGDKPARVSKEGAQQRLTAAIEAAGQNADAEIVSKLTGKAAVHFAEIIEAITK